MFTIFLNTVIGICWALYTMLCIAVLYLLLNSSTFALIGGGYEQLDLLLLIVLCSSSVPKNVRNGRGRTEVFRMDRIKTNVVLRFTPFDPSYLFPYLARRLSFRRLKDPIIKKLESAPLIKY